MSNTSKIAEAEAKFRKLQRDSDEREKARNQYEIEQKATREKTERLRALRLAKEAVEARGAGQNHRSNRRERGLSSRPD